MVFCILVKSSTIIHMGYEQKNSFPGQEDMRAQMAQLEISAISKKITENSNEITRLTEELNKEDLSDDEKYEIGFKLTQATEEGEELVKRRAILFAQNGIDI